MRSVTGVVNRHVAERMRKSNWRSNLVLSQHAHVWSRPACGTVPSINVSAVWLYTCTNVIRYVFVKPAASNPINEWTAALNVHFYWPPKPGGKPTLAAKSFIRSFMACETNGDKNVRANGDNTMHTAFQDKLRHDCCLQLSLSTSASLSFYLSLPLSRHSPVWISHWRLNTIKDVLWLYPQVHGCIRQSSCTSQRDDPEGSLSRSRQVSWW